MAKPGLISVGIFNVLGQWNQYMLPDRAAAAEPDNERMLTQGLVQLRTQQGYEGDWSGLFAGLVIAMLPVLVVVPRPSSARCSAGLTAGALK